MKTVVINFSGNVGKTTIARHLLVSRLTAARLVSVETVNRDGADTTVFRAKQFGQLIESLATVDDAVVDVGSSNAEEFLQRMRDYRGSHEDFDLYVLPTVPALKQQHGTVTTIEALAELGVPAQKIRVLFNMLEPEDDPARTFAAIMKYHAARKTFTLREGAVLRVNEVFARIDGTSVSLADIASDPADLKVQLRSTGKDADKLRISRQISVRRLATGVLGELDAAFRALVK
jgi:hypothetical protein